MVFVTSELFKRFPMETLSKQSVKKIYTVNYTKNDYLSLDAM